tara:strand:- start:18 stop:215 length:198 start_codon:yes stop_codon:yes gene_type:complete
MDVNRETGEVDPNLMYSDDEYDHFELWETTNDDKFKLLNIKNNKNKIDDTFFSLKERSDRDHRTV